MADNKTIDNGGLTDFTAATDEIAGVDYQYVKLVDGTPDSTAKIQGTEANGLEVDVTRLPTLATGSKVQLTDGTSDATVRNLAANDALNVAIVDGSGNQVTSFGGSGGTASTDDSAFTAGSGSGTPMMGFASSDTVDANDVGVVKMDTSRRLQVDINAVTSTATAASIFRSLDLDETEEEIKATSGVVYGMWVTNTATSTRFVKFYNATAANVTVGSTTPVLTLGIPGNSSDDVSGMGTTGGPGISFGTAITVAATTGVLDSDTGAPGANEVIVNIFYE